jgi:adenylate kinase family enzyme
MQTKNLKIENLHRVSVVGTSCSGKTTFAKRLAGILNAEHIEIDAFNFLSDWIQRPRDEFMNLVEQAADRDRWVFDGNYTRTRETSGDAQPQSSGSIILSRSLFTALLSGRCAAF